MHSRARIKMSHGHMKAKESRIRVSHGHMNARKVNIASIRGDQNATTTRHRSKCGPLRRDHSTPARGEGMDARRIRPQSPHEPDLSRLPRARRKHAVADVRAASGEGL